MKNLIKNINLLVLLLIKLESPIHAAQESLNFAKATTDTSNFSPDFAQSDLRHGKVKTDKKVQDELTKQNRQEIITNTVKNFPNLVEGFEILQQKNLVDQSFHDYFAEHLNHDEDQEANSGEIITNAIDLVIDKMNIPFLVTLNNAIIKNIEFTKIHDPIFLYVMKYKDEFMQIPLKQWVNTTNRKIRSIDEPYSSMDFNEKNYYEYDVFYKKLVCPRCINSIPLHFAVYSNNIAAIKILISLGAHLNIQGSCNLTALHIAVLRDQSKTVKMLINLGADLNIQCLNGYTPLHTAIFHRKKTIAKLLIHAGADITIQDVAGNTAEQIAKEHEMRIVFAQTQRNNASSLCTIS